MQYYEKRAGANPDFRKGVIHDDPIHFPTSNTTLLDTAKVDGLYFKGRTSIYMKEDGTLIIGIPA